MSRTELGQPISIPVSATIRPLLFDQLECWKYYHQQVEQLEPFVRPGIAQFR